MICKHCKTEVNDDWKACPHCGKKLIEAPKPKWWHLALYVTGATALLVALAWLLLTAFGIDLRPRANDIHKKDKYTVSVEKAQKSYDKVIAKLAEKELTNAQLQIYYRMQIVDFVNYYGSYLSYLGFDYNKPLSEQQCASDKELTWEQYFLEVAIETWQNYQVMAMLAEEAGFTMTDEAKKVLEELPASLEEEAKEGKYDSVDAMLEDIVGPGCTLDEYMKYVELTLLRNDYYASEYERLMPTDAEVEAYFTENEKVFTESGITKDMGLFSSVRHILIEPAGGEKDEETGLSTYTEKAWQDALKEAEALLDTWKKGEATEETFSELANKNSADGDGTTGGLYEGIYKGSGMVKEFEAWCIDPARKSGDTGVVKTVYGYHIMYFVEGEPYWSYSATAQLLAERTAELIDEAAKRWPMEVNYGKIAVVEVL